MAISSTIQPAVNSIEPAKEQPANNAMASLLSMVILSVYAGQKSRKQLRKIRRKMAWLLLKQRIQNAFSRPAPSERQIIIYILIGLLALILLIYYPIAALVLAIIALILLLTGSI